MIFPFLSLPFFQQIKWIRSCWHLEKGGVQTLIYIIVHSGVIMADYGHKWKEHRRFALMTMRNFGLGKQSMEDRILKELQITINNLEKNAGKWVTRALFLFSQDTFEHNKFHIHAMVNLNSHICVFVLKANLWRLKSCFTTLPPTWSAWFCSGNDLTMRMSSYRDMWAILLKLPSRWMDHGRL